MHVTPESHPFEVIETDHGMGGMGDARSSLFGRFSTKEQIIKILTEKGYTLRYRSGGFGDRVLGEWYPGDGNTYYIGMLTYSVKISKETMIVE